MIFLSLILFRNSRRTILLNYLFFFFQERLFLKRFLEHIKFSRRLGCNKKTYDFSRRRHNSLIRTHQIFQENQKWYKNACKFSRRAFSRFCKNRYEQIFQENISPRIFCKIAFSDAFASSKKVTKEF